MADSSTFADGEVAEEAKSQDPGSIWKRVSSVLFGSCLLIARDCLFEASVIAIGENAPDPPSPIHTAS